jgi:hypothetical protein
LKAALRISFYSGYYYIDVLVVLVGELINILKGKGEHE